MTAPRRNWKLALAGTLFAALMMLSPLASASGSGYNLSFSSTAGSGNANVDFTSLTTSASGSTVTVSAQVAGQFMDNNALYFYDFFFGGAGATNSTAYVALNDNVTDLTLLTLSGGYGFSYIPFTLSSGNSVITFSVNQTTVGPSSTFTANAEAAYGTAGSGGSVGWIGSDFGGGSATCTATGCTSTSTTSSGLSTLGYAVIGIVVVVIVVVVVVLVMRRKKTPPAAPMMAPPPAEMAPPPPPPPQ